MFWGAMPEFGAIEKSRIFVSAITASLVLPKGFMRGAVTAISLAASATERLPLTTDALAYGSDDWLTVPSAKVSV